MVNVLHLSWEYPPRSIGGLASHVHDLSVELAKLGHNVHVVTCDFPGASEYERYKNVHVHRFESYRIPSDDFLIWTLQMNLYMKMKAADIINELDYNIDIIHAHDWLTGPAAISLKNSFRLPLVSTIHATEHGRRHGIHNDFQRMIHNIEWWLIFNSWRVIACSNYMKNEISTLFNVDTNKITVIHNGVNIEKFKIKFNRGEMRNRFALPYEKIILFVGRLVMEKGVHVLIGSVPKVIEKYPDAKFIIAGDGYMKNELMKIAYELGVAHKVYFTGYIDDFTLAALYNLADIAVFPSLYEPFGIVALEGMASNSATVATDTGGLSEIIKHDYNGIKVWVDNSDSLAWGILYLLENPDHMEWIKKNGVKTVKEEYSWELISRQTADLYDLVLREYQKNDWKPTVK